MAIDRSSPADVPRWIRRMVEWGIVLVLMLVFLGAMVRQVRVVQGQGELAAVKSTLGALRTALVIDHLQQAVHVTKPTVAEQQRNPFMLLKEVPANYAGEFGASQIETVVPGSWVFDPDCRCVGYLLSQPQWLDNPTYTQALWFQLSSAPGPLQITAIDAYIWQGQALN